MSIKVISLLFGVLLAVTSCKSTGQSSNVKNIPNDTQETEISADAARHVDSLLGIHSGDHLVHVNGTSKKVDCTITVDSADGGETYRVIIRQEGQETLNQPYTRNNLLRGYKQFKNSSDTTFNRSIEISIDKGGILSGSSRTENIRFNFYSSPDEETSPLLGVTWQHTESEGQFSQPRVKSASCWRVKVES